MTREEELQVLKMIQTGVIGAAEGERLLQALAGSSSADEATPRPAPSTPARSLRRYPLIAGSLLAGLGAVALAAEYAGAGGLRALAYFVLGLGVLVTLVGLWLARAVWVLIHVSKAGSGRARASLAIPLPLTVAAWAIRLASPHLRQFDATSLDEIILALRDCARQGQVVSLDVYKQDDDERIRVSIG